jgi:hypothetical protein
MYPSVRKMEGMSRQGQFIGLTQKAKRVVETLYLSGLIMEQIVYQSGTGSKGNCTDKKQLITEVICLLLGNPFDVANGHWRLDDAYMITLQPLITTKNDRTRLEKETSFIQHDDSAGVLLNGVNHIYRQINVMKDREKSTTSQEGVKDILDEIMEYEPENVFPNINDHIFDIDNNRNEFDGDNDIIAVEEGGIEQTGLTLCLVDLVELGWRKLHEMNIHKVRMVAKE